MRFLSFFIVCFVLWPVDLCNAQSISTIQEMTFGEANVRRNDNVYSIVISSNGGISAGSNFDYLINGREGVYLLSGAAPLRPITVNVIVDQQMTGSGQQMTIDDFMIDAPPITDINGEAVISVGARLRTNGNGMNYFANTDFIAQMTLSVNVL